MEKQNPESNLHEVFKVETQKSIFLGIGRRNGMNMLAMFRIPLPDDGEHEELVHQPLQKLKSLIHTGGKIQNLNDNEKAVLLDLFVNYQEEIMKNLRTERDQYQSKKQKPAMKLVHMDHKKVNQEQKRKHWNKHHRKAVG